MGVAWRRPLGKVREARYHLRVPRSEGPCAHAHVLPEGQRDRARLARRRRRGPGARPHVHRGRPHPARQAQADLRPPPRHRRPRHHRQRRQGRAHRRQGRAQGGRTATPATRAASSARPTPSCSPASRPTPSAARSGACCPRARSAARCSKKLKVYAGPTTRTPPSSPSPLELVRAKRPLSQETHAWPQPLTQTTGRRKEAIARVRLRPGTGDITINGRAVRALLPDADPPHGRSPSRCGSPRPTEIYDVDATINGGGVTGQAGALRMAIARALVELDPELRPTLKKAGFLTRDAREEGEQEVRPEEGPQGAAVPEALSASPGRMTCGSAPTASGASPTPSSRPSSPSPSAAPRPACSAATVAVVGRDTRLSRPAARGGASPPGWPPRASTSSGSACVPTPAVAFVAGPTSCPAAMISASHNPFADNGIKLFAPGGTQADRRRRGARSRPSCDGRGRSPAVPPGDVGAGWSTSSRQSPALRRAPRRRRSTAAGLDGLRVVSTAPTAPPSALAARRARRARRRRRRRSTPSPTARNINDGCGSTHPARSPRRSSATAPTSAWPSTATPTGCIAVDHTGARRRRRPADRHLRPRPARPGRAARRHGRGHGDDQPRVPPGDGRRRHHGRRDAGRRPLRARGARARRLLARRRAERPRDLPRPGHDRRRPAHRPAAARRRRPHRARRSPSWPARR